MFAPNHAQIEAAVLQVNTAFYRAFNEGSFASMRELWAREAPVVCFHPGSAALFGREPVLESWKQILRGGPIDMRCDQPKVFVLGNAAIVTCYEGNGKRAAHLAATNVFVLEEDRWRMMHHQAGPLSTPIPSLRAVPPASVN